jgi:hypothetical protein
MSDAAADAATRYDQCPLAAAGFTLVRFEELGTRVIGPDGRCCCTVAARCPDVDRTARGRCTLADLRELDAAAARRRAWQMGWD